MNHLAFPATLQAWLSRCSVQSHNHERAKPRTASGRTAYPGHLTRTNTSPTLCLGMIVPRHSWLGQRVRVQSASELPSWPDSFWIGSCALTAHAPILALAAKHGGSTLLQRHLRSTHEWQYHHPCACPSSRKERKNTTASLSQHQ